MLSVIDSEPPGPLLQHAFHAVAFIENFSLKDLALTYPAAKRSARVLIASPAGGGKLYLYPFGAMVFLNVSAEVRAQELENVQKAVAGLKLVASISEDLMVLEDATAPSSVADGVLTLDT